MLSALAGCTGHASVHVVPFDNQRLSFTSPLVVQFRPDECYWSVNENGELCIAMRARRRSLLGRRYDREFVLSLVLDEKPAGPARHYRVARRTARARHDAGLSHTRAASLAGRAAVWNFGQARIDGRFRFTARRQSFSALKGWGGNRTVLFVGEFTALPDRGESATIMARTEEDALARPPRRSGPYPVQGPRRTEEP
jgi:hypothetical protein